jgi:Icc-related predicted phosphoesterase
MKIVALSDTHTQHRNVKVPKGDILIYAGDFEIRTLPDLSSMSYWLNHLHFKHVVTIFGNHDFTDNLPHDLILDIFGNKITYLCNNFVEIEGLKIWGSSSTPRCGHWAWMKSEQDLNDIWDTIPKDTDVVITHPMPYGILDQVMPKMESVGSITLRDKIKEIQPKIHIGGHIHEGFGKYTDGKIDYYNVSILDEMYKLVNPITIINI